MVNEGFEEAYYVYRRRRIRFQTLKVLVCIQITNGSRKVTFFLLVQSHSIADSPLQIANCENYQKIHLKIRRFGRMRTSLRSQVKSGQQMKILRSV